MVAPDGVAIASRQVRLRDVRHHGLIVEAVGQRTHHDRGAVAVIVRVAFDVSRQAQRLQDAIRGRARQLHRIRQGIDGGAFEPIQGGEHVESPIQGPDGAGGVPSLGLEVVVNVAVIYGACLDVHSCA
jgi:hypothetical protein